MSVRMPCSRSMRYCEELAAVEANCWTWFIAPKVKQWGTVFPGASCVLALVDRFVQHDHVLDIEAESWREKHALKPSEWHPAGVKRR